MPSLASRKGFLCGGAIVAVVASSLAWTAGLRSHPAADRRDAPPSWSALPGVGVTAAGVTAVGVTEVGVTEVGGRAALGPAREPLRIAAILSTADALRRPLPPLAEGTLFNDLPSDVTTSLAAPPAFNVEAGVAIEPTPEPSQSPTVTTPAWLREPFALPPDEGAPEFAAAAPPAPSGPALIDPSGRAQERSAKEPSPSLSPSASRDAEGESEDAFSSAEATLPTATPLTMGVLTSERVNEQARERIRAGSALASRGAYFTAQRELIAALRMLTQAADKQVGAPRFTTALAAGLRALEEAGDFVPRGTALDADVDVAVLTASHQTPVAKGTDVRKLLPSDVADRYYLYAQQQLGAATEGSPAGSMALHFLGKLNRELGRVETGRVVDGQRRAFALQQAALIARPDNDMAAHELAVLMAEAGYDGAAEMLLAQVMQRQPHPTVLRNLANVQSRLGKAELAAAHRDLARRMAAERGGDGRVAWVPPTAFAQTSAGALSTNGPSPAAPAAAPRQATFPLGASARQ